MCNVVGMARTPAHRDPLEDDPGPTTPAGLDRYGRCPNPRCDGGFVQVLPAYAEQLHPMPDAPQLGASDEELQVYARRVASVEALRRSAVDSFYPCKECRPSAFFMWANHYSKPGHSCAECQPGPKRRHVA